MKLKSWRSSNHPWLAVAAAGSVTLLLAGCGGTAPPSGNGDSGEIEEMTISLAYFSNDNDPVSLSVQEWQDRVTDRTDGKVTFENYWSSSLLGAGDSLSGTRDGVADMSILNNSYYPQELPITAWLAGVGNAVTGSMIHDIAGAGAAINEFFQTEQEIIDEYAAQDLKVLNVSPTSTYTMLCTSPVESAEQAQGKRARSTGDLWTQAMASVGMVATDVAYAEVYEALQRGVIDCMTAAPGSFSSLGLEEIATEFLPLAYAQTQASLVVNLSFWDDLPGELQAIMLEEAAELTGGIAEKYLGETAVFGDLIADGTIRVNDVTALSPSVDAARAAGLQNMPSTAPDSVSDAQGMINRYSDRVDHWTQGIADSGYPVAAVDPESIREAYVAFAEVDLTDFFAEFSEEFRALVK